MPSIESLEKTYFNPRPSVRGDDDPSPINPDDPDFNPRPSVRGDLRGV